MADIETVNYHWIKPENGASADDWGIKWNSNLDAMDAKLKSVEIAVEDAQDGADLSLKIASNLSEIDDDTKRTAARSNIGAQKVNANLTALAGLIGASNKLPYFDGSESMMLTDLTGVGRDLIDSADAAAGRNVLGIQNVRDIAVYVQNDTPSSPPANALWAW